MTEAEDAAVILGVTDRAFLIRLTDGARVEVGPELLRDATVRSDPTRLLALLTSKNVSHAPWLPDFAAKSLAAADLSLEVRICLRMALALRGSEGETARLLGEIGEMPHGPMLGAVLRVLPRAVGPRAVEAMRPALAALDDATWRGAVDGFALLSRSTSELLEAELSRQDLTPIGRRRLLDAAASVESPGESLLDLLESLALKSDPETERTAAGVLLRGDSAAIRSRLLSLMEKAPALDIDLATYFTVRPTPEATPGLIRMLIRASNPSTPDEFLQMNVMQALAACTGLRLGLDAKRWIEWWNTKAPK